MPARTLFRSLQIRDWQQFDSVTIDLSEQVTIITGKNSTGKSTLLRILALHASPQQYSLAVPPSDSSDRGAWSLRTRPRSQRDDIEVGTITYEDEHVAKLQLESVASPVYSLQIVEGHSVKTVYIPSHRPCFDYAVISNIEFSNYDEHAAYSRVSEAHRASHKDMGPLATASSRIKNTLLTWCLLGGSSDRRNGDREILGRIYKFEELLRILLPPEIGFRQFSFRNFEVVMVCDTGEFLFDGLSGGVASILELAWLLQRYSGHYNEPFVVAIDEIESHLHPSMQRRILPDLCTAFPHCRFIVATHSPLVVTSVMNSGVHILDHTNENKIISRRLDMTNQPLTATQVLNEVLGVPASIPLWAQAILDHAVAKATLNAGSSTKDTLKYLSQTLRENGLYSLLPEALYMALEQNYDPPQTP